MNHGAMVSETASTAPNPGASQLRPLLYKRYQAHAPSTGATDITTGSVSPPTPLSTPKPTHCHTDDELSRWSASRKTKLISKVVKVVAQIKSAEKKIA